MFGLASWLINEEWNILKIAALMIDVDGGLVDGRPEDGQRWQTSLAEDLGVDRQRLQYEFFVPHWDDIIVGRADLLPRLRGALSEIAPHVEVERFVDYWFERDSRVSKTLVAELSRVRHEGTRVYLATNQEHLRAAYLMKTLRFAEHVDGIFYSAALGVRKPDSAFFAKVQKALRLPSDEILLVDDSPPNIDAARRAGWSGLRWTGEASASDLRQLLS